MHRPAEPGSGAPGWSGRRRRPARGGIAGAIAAALLLAGGCGVPRLMPAIPGPGTPQPFMKAMTDVPYDATVFCGAASDRDLAKIRATGANWVVLGAVWNQAGLTSTAIRPSGQTTTDHCLLHAMAVAHRLGMSVAIKPYDDPLGAGWRAEYAPASWPAWFSSYTTFIDHYAALAQRGRAQLFVVGCEYSSSDGTQTAAWERVIASVRRLYRGPLAYAANWPQYRNVRFWSDLDYVGIDAYFPLAAQGNPTVAQAEAAWTPWLDQIEAWRRSAGLTGKKVIFTEIGYLSRSGAAENPADYTGSAPVDLQVQADLFQATLARLYTVPWLQGLFWFWWDNDSTADSGGGRSDPGFTPRGKPALAVLTDWYHRDWNDRPAG